MEKFPHRPCRLRSADSIVTHLDATAIVERSHGERSGGRRTIAGPILTASPRARTVPLS